MYICLCNSLREKDMAAAIESGAQCVSEIYKHHGCAPQCGKCVPYVREIYATPVVTAQPVQ